MRVAVVAVPSFTVWQPQDYFHETSPKSFFFLCSSSFCLALFRACFDCDTSRKSLHCQGQQAAVFEMPSKPNYSMTPTGVSHGTKWHGEVGSRHGSVLHFLEGWTLQTALSFQRMFHPFLRTGQSVPSKVCLCLCPHVQQRCTAQDPRTSLPSVSNELISCLLFQIN